jgi:putative membrane protein
MMRFPFRGNGHMDGFGGHHLGGAGIAGLILMIILWAVVIAALVLVIRSLVTHYRRGPGYYGGGKPWGGHPTTPDRTDALRILHERYARGEIGRDEYLQRRNDLTSNAGEPPKDSTAPVPPPPAPPEEPPATS